MSFTVFCSFALVSGSAFLQLFKTTLNTNRKQFFHYFYKGRRDMTGHKYGESGLKTCPQRFIQLY